MRLCMRVRQSDQWQPASFAPMECALLLSALAHTPDALRPTHPHAPLSLQAMSVRQRVQALERSMGRSAAVADLIDFGPQPRSCLPRPSAQQARFHTCTRVDAQPASCKTKPGESRFDDDFDILPDDGAYPAAPPSPRLALVPKRE